MAGGMACAGTGTACYGLFFSKLISAPGGGHSPVLAQQFRLLPHCQKQSGGGAVPSLEQLARLTPDQYSARGYTHTGMFGITPEQEAAFERRQAAQRAIDFDKGRFAKRPYKLPKSRPLLTD